MVSIFLTGNLNAQYVGTNTFNSSAYWEREMFSNRFSGSAIKKGTIC